MFKDRELDRAVVIVAICFAIVALVFFLFRPRDRVGYGVEFTPADAPAIINKGSQLYNQLDYDSQLKMIRLDLATFARSTIEKYRDKKVKDIVFEVKAVEGLENNKSTFRGSFKEESKDTVSVDYEKLPYGRIKLSIRSKKHPETNLDSQLSSNNQRNQAISKLPLKEENYTIDFDPITEKFIINFGLRSLDLKNKALAKLGLYLGEDVKNEQIKIIAPPSVNGPTDYVILDEEE